MSCSDRPAAPMAIAHKSAGAVAVLAAEAGLPYTPPLGKASGIDPIAEWLDLMEVVQMLCPTWPVRDQPMRGDNWRL